MASSSITKVVLKSTTKISLNERFTEILTSKQRVRVTIQATVPPEQQQQQEQQEQQQVQEQQEREKEKEKEKKEKEKEKEQQDQPAPSASSSSRSSSHGSVVTRAESGNRKLAQEMESRPSVQAALTLKADRFKQLPSKSNMRSRLGWPFGSLAKRSVRGLGGPPDRGSSQGGSSQGGSSQGASSSRGPSHGGWSHGGPSREGGLSRPAGAHGERQGEWVSRFRQQGSGGTQASGDQEPQKSQSASPQTNVRKGGGHRGFGWGGAPSYGGVTTGRGGVTTGHGRVTTGYRGVTTGHRGHGSNMAGRGQGTFEVGGPWPRVASQAPLTKEQLDSQLDAYMAKSREQLDAELDTYMAQPGQKSNR